MPEYIKREAALAELKKMPAYFDSADTRYGITLAVNAICALPAADVAPVRHGRWTRGPYACGEYEFKCSACGTTEWHTSQPTPFCPHCGAKMDLGAEGQKKAPD